MAKSLDEYHSKRNFAATPEPAGAAGRRKSKASSKALQYTIQKHDASHLHYDFRLELDGTLKSWAIPKGPSLDPKVRRLAVHVEDHPLEYARFEGSIPQGHYGAGEVIVWDRGIWLPEGDPQQGYALGKLHFALQGEKLSGAWHLFRTNLAGKKEQWFLVKSSDAKARSTSEYDVVAAEPDSVISQRQLVPRNQSKAHPAAKPETKKPIPGAKTTDNRKQVSMPKSANSAIASALPALIKPQLATLAASPPAGDWRYEVKFDGYRILARVEGSTVQLFTRNGHDWTDRMPTQVAALRKLKLGAAWLDGEMVVLNDAGLADFQALQNAFDSRQDAQLVFFLFDQLYRDGEDLRGRPLHERRAALQASLARNRSSQLRFSTDFDEPVESLLDSACRMQLEGLIGKRQDSLYVGRRSADWIKLKCTLRQEFVIVGYTDPQGSRSGFGALLLGLHDTESGELRYAGKVGTGFSSASLQRLHARLTPLRINNSPLPRPPRGPQVRGVHWIQPILLAEVAYAEITRDGVVRHAVFHGLRDDKPANKIDLERPMIKTPQSSKPPKKRSTQQLETLHLTHPERIVDASSGATKHLVAEYYAQVAPWILPQLQHRPVALVRAPDGLSGELFFQKHAERLEIPGLISHDKAEAGQAAMIINRGDTLLGAVQMNTLEFHTWNATSKDFDKPDRFILDLDPDPVLPWKTVVEATQLTLTLLDELGLQSFLKTSGGKGMHIVVPLIRKAGWDDVKSFSHALVKYLAKLFPDRLSAISGPKNRVGRIFIDYLRNAQGATTVSAYSLRARAGLPVSVPIGRDELSQIKGANQWTVFNLHERLATGLDPWADYASTRQSITAAMRKRMGVA